MDGDFRPGESDRSTGWTVPGPRRRDRILSILLDRSRPTTERELAAGVVDREVDGSAGVSEETLREVRVAVHHVDLPKLEGAGLVERLSTGLVATERADHAATGSPTRRDVPGAIHDALLAIDGHPRRRRIVSIVADRKDPLALDDLAAELAGDVVGPDGEDAADLRLRTRLHHADLPKLDGADLLDYDAELKSIAPRPLSARVQRLDDRDE